MEEKELVEVPENALVLGEVKPPTKDIQILDQFVENLRLKKLSRVASCFNCGSQSGQLVRADKRDKSKGYVCRTCIENFYRNNRSR